MRRIKTWLLRMVLAGVVLGALGAVVAAVAYKRYVIDDPGPDFERDRIQAIIAQESPILFRDGVTRVGVLFAEEHREYVPYARIPKAWVQAIVAAEDDRYWQHHGVDPKGVARATWKNLKAGGLVAGGSTLTQQTAKNLFARPDRSLRSKLIEALGAFRLEEHYSKEDILEFYANQFHVNANGRGLGIAARYFFDKEVEQLGTLECAYLAGMVQAPARYNPFVGATEAEQAASRSRAHGRTRYVLGRMHKLGDLSDAQYAELSGAELPFKRGAFQYDSSVLVDEVAARLEEAPFPQVFEELGITNPSTAGVMIVTTLDANAQREAQYALSHHLTETGLFLEKGTAKSLLLPPERAPRRDPHKQPEDHTFRTGRVSTATADGVVLDLGGPTCVVDREGLKRMATALARAEKGESWREATKDEIQSLVSALPTGSVVLASVRGANACDLEFRPELQGATMLLERGQIRAMVGGSDNQNFNRAITAKRQLGSTWKTLVYYAALQLGWTPTDALDNRANAFPFEGSWYYPRADHKSVDTVSLAWAGTRSENLASIWLLYHLTDRLSPEELRQVAAQVGLAPAAGESAEAYRKRVRDDLGVISTSERLEEMAFNAAKAELLRGGLPYPDDSLDVVSLLYGRGADGELAKVARASADERARVQAAVGRNFLAAEARMTECLSAFSLAKDWAQGLAPPPPAHLISELWVQGGMPVSVSCGRPGEGWSPLADLTASVGVVFPSEDSLRIGGLHVGTLRALRQSLERRRLVLAGADLYDVDTLLLHPDFRALVNMSYLAELARQLGVTQDLPRVLSLPLGAVDISVEDAAVLYQGIQDGQRWSFPGQIWTDSGMVGLRSASPVPAPPRATQLIAEIRDRDGNVLYRAAPVPEPVADPVAGRLVGDILRNVVLWGTGQRAKSAVLLGGAVVPVAGKTGTTNSYKNAAFAGFLPVVSGGGWLQSGGYTAVSYVGYDDNRPMKRGGAKIQGSSGALPAWIGLAQGMAKAGLLGASAPASSELLLDQGMAQVAVDPDSGQPVVRAEGEAGPTVLVLGDGAAPARRVVPFKPRGGFPAAPVSAPPPAAPPDTGAPTYLPPDELPPEGGAPAEGDATETPPAAPPDTGVDPRIAPPDAAPDAAPPPG